ncbi:manganese efflux pump MntP [Nitrincola tapanii]
MSTDAFAAAVGKGACLYKPKFREALRMGVIFGTIEAITPLLGWLLGQVAVTFVESWGHWIAFGLLTAIGLHMIHEGLQPVEACESKPTSHSFWKLGLTAVGTSIDALAVGVSLAFLDVNIFWAASMIGLATMTMVTLGVLLGRTLGALIGHRAEILGGLVLIGVGATLLITQL